MRRQLLVGQRVVSLCFPCRPVRCLDCRPDYCPACLAVVLGPQECQKDQVVQALSRVLSGYGFCHKVARQELDTLRSACRQRLVSEGDDAEARVFGPLALVFMEPLSPRTSLALRYRFLAACCALHTQVPGFLVVLVPSRRTASNAEKGCSESAALIHCILSRHSLSSTLLCRSVFLAFSGRGRRRGVRAATR